MQSFMAAGSPRSAIVRSVLVERFPLAFHQLLDGHVRFMPRADLFAGVAGRKAALGVATVGRLGVGR
jgi:hypothetical protein